MSDPPCATPVSRMTSGSRCQIASCTRTRSSGSWMTGRPNQVNVHWYLTSQATRSHAVEIASKAARVGEAAPCRSPSTASPRQVRRDRRRSRGRRRAERRWPGPVSVMRSESRLTRRNRARPGLCRRVRGRSCATLARAEKRARTRTTRRIVPSTVGRRRAAPLHSEAVLVSGFLPPRTRRQSSNPRAPGPWRQRRSHEGAFGCPWARPPYLLTCESPAKIACLGR